MQPATGRGERSGLQDLGRRLSGVAASQLTATVVGVMSARSADMVLGPQLYAL